MLQKDREIAPQGAHYDKKSGTLLAPAFPRVHGVFPTHFLKFLFDFYVLPPPLFRLCFRSAVGWGIVHHLAVIPGRLARENPDLAKASVSSASAADKFFVFSETPRLINALCIHVAVEDGNKTWDTARTL